MSEQLLTVKELEARGMATTVELSAEQLEAERADSTALLREIQELINASQE